LQWIGPNQQSQVGGKVIVERQRFLPRKRRSRHTWQYHYNEETGIVTKKLIIRPGQNPHLEETYDEHGNKIESHSLAPGQLND
jgi:hypothetical protein